MFTRGEKTKLIKLLASIFLICSIQFSYGIGPSALKELNDVHRYRLVIDDYRKFKGRILVYDDPGFQRKPIMELNSKGLFKDKEKVCEPIELTQGKFKSPFNHLYKVYSPDEKRPTERFCGKSYLFRMGDPKYCSNNCIEFPIIAGASDIEWGDTYFLFTSLDNDHYVYREDGKEYYIKLENIDIDQKNYRFSSKSKIDDLAKFDASFDKFIKRVRKCLKEKDVTCLKKITNPDDNNKVPDNGGDFSGIIDSRLHYTRHSKKYNRFPNPKFAPAEKVKEARKFREQFDKDIQARIKTDQLFLDIIPYLDMCVNLHPNTKIDYSSDYINFTSRSRDRSLYITCTFKKSFLHSKRTKRVWYLSEFDIDRRGSWTWPVGPL